LFYLEKIPAPVARVTLAGDEVERSLARRSASKALGARAASLRHP
jgi:hypothetical protein